MTQAKDILNAIDGMLSGKSLYSRHSARKYYKTSELALLLQMYFNERKLSKREASRQLGISASSLSRLMSGYDISEIMLFRARNYFEEIDRIEHPSIGGVGDLIGKPWKLTDTASIQDAISVVSLSLSFLHRAGHPHLPMNFQCMETEVGLGAEMPLN
jgi:hypothetical protein